MNFSEAVERTLNFLGIRKRAYQITFGNSAGRAVLSDLAKFCRANDPCFHPDPYIHAALEGRRQVFLRIQRHLNLTEEDLFKLYSAGGLPPDLETK